MFTLKAYPPGFNNLPAFPQISEPPALDPFMPALELIYSFVATHITNPINAKKATAAMVSFIPSPLA